MSNSGGQLAPSWQVHLATEFSKPYMQALKSFLLAEKNQHKCIYPKGGEYFKAFELTPFESVKVVILGQDPYHGPGQAHGLSFSVPPGVDIPPSLRNIYQELASDLQLVPPKTGDLSAWAKQGVLLLNSVLTVEGGLAGSHQGRGWEQFTDQTIAALNENREHLVFVLWGSYAKNKGQFIDRSKHLVLESPHPSPLSAHRGFFGSRPFSRANEYLKSHQIEPIHWI